MPTKKTKEETPQLTEREIASAVTNSPFLHDNKFTLGDRTFTVVDLEYDAYVEFTTMLTPLINILLARAGGVSLPDMDTSALTAHGIAQLAKNDLPEMARIVCAATDPEITVAEVKRLAKTPFVLANVVIAQMLKNNVISDFASVFHQLRHLIPQSIQPTA